MMNFPSFLKNIQPGQMLAGDGEVEQEEGRTRTT